MTPEDIEAKRKADEKRLEEEKKRAADAAAAAAQEMELQRCLHIKEVARKMNLGDDFETRMISERKTKEQVNAEAIEALAQRQTPPAKNNPSIVVGDQVGLEAARRGVENALLVRTGVLSEKELTSEGRDFRSDNLLRMFEEIERAKGRSVRGLAGMKLAARALHSDSDLPEILSNIANKHMIGGYNSIPQDWRPVVQEVDLKDFKETSSLDLSMMGDLVEKLPGEDYQLTTLVEGKEKYKAKTYGRMIAFTREMMINDDLRALTEIPNKFGQAASRTETKSFFSILSTNAAMADGTNLFHADHLNLNSNTGVNNDAISKLMLLIEKQKDLAGEFIQAYGKYLIVPVDYKKTVETLLAAIAATKASDVNIHAGKYTPIFSPYLGTGAIFGAADKTQITSIEVGYVQGNRSVYMDETIDFKSDGIHMKARLDFGMKAVNHRGLSKVTIS